MKGTHYNLGSFVTISEAVEERDIFIIDNCLIEYKLQGAAK